MQKAEDLKNILNRIDHKGYPAYKDTRGEYQFPGYRLAIDHVQGDPFASPSKLSIHVSGEKAGFPKEYYESSVQRIVLQDFLVREFGRLIEKYSFQAKGSGKSGMISISRCGQEVLERSACQMYPESGALVLRFEVGFPARGRTISAQELIRILFEFLPECVNSVVFYSKCRKRVLQGAMELAENQHFIRKQLSDMGLCAFVANGSILPRESGVSQRPMKSGIAFESPKELEVQMHVPHGPVISGMGIRKGITLIVGGGYHGKSTLLKALELGVYDHIQGDGREYVITEESAMKLRAEDGRSIRRTDISMFINDLPNGNDTTKFYTEDASGSTSQAANVVESMEAGSKVLLIDEDTSATNFMIRDELMQRVIHREMEPITPFIDRIRELYETWDISTVLVAGSSGAYFHIADTIIQMDRYEPKEITRLAKEEANAFPAMSGCLQEAQKPDFARRPSQGRGFRSQDRIKMKTFGKEAFSLNRENIDLRYVEQIVDSEQVTALSYCLKYAEQHLFDGRTSIREIVKQIDQKLEKEGVASICENRSNIANMARPRSQEIMACLNRYRGLNI